MERKLIAAAVSSALALPMAAQAVEFSASGHINRALISVDGTGAANEGDIQHVDSNASETRFRFTGSEEMDGGMTAGVQLEIGRPGDWRTRHANVYLSSAAGKVTIGQASAATDGMAHARLGGPSWLGGVTNWCSYHSSGPACPSNDGGRREVLKYDTPAIGPASIAFSAGDDDYWDVMLKIAGSMGDAGYDIRIGHIGEYDTMVAVPAVEGMPGVAEVPGVEGVPAGQMITRINGSDLEDLLAMENRDSDTFWEAGTDGNLGTDDDTRDATVSLSDAQTAIDAHIAASEGSVVAIDQVGTTADTDIGADGAAFYKTEATEAVEAMAGTPAVPGKPYVPASMMPGTAGDITTASAAVSFGQGTSAAVAWSENQTSDNEYQYVELDHSYGDGSVGVYYKTGETAGTDGSLWGIGIGHNVGAGATAYAGYRQISEDHMEDIDLIVAGMRVTFN